MSLQISSIARAAALGCLLTAGMFAAGNGAIEPVVPVVAPATTPGSTDNRILGVLPTYMVVEDTNRAAPALTTKQKFQLFLRETTDPSTFAAAGIAAALSQSGNETPRYGVGAGPYGQRLGAAYADVA